MAFFVHDVHTCALLSCGLAASQRGDARHHRRGEARPALLLHHVDSRIRLVVADHRAPRSPDVDDLAASPPEKFESGAGTLPAFADVASSSQPPTQMTPSFSHGQYHRLRRRRRSCVDVLAGIAG